MVVPLSGAEQAAPYNTLAGDLRGVLLPDGSLGLLPVPTGLPACLGLQRRCLRLTEGGGAADRRLPATAQSSWLCQPTGEVLPVPRLAMPGGQPVATWLRSGEATAADLVQWLAETAVLVDALAGEGWEADGLGLDGVWVEAGHLTWLPAAAGWERPRRLPTVRSLAASGRALGLFLRALLAAGHNLPGMGLLWEELWALCHEWLECGYGLSVAGLAATLAPLRRRFSSDAEAEAPPEAIDVLVDADSLQRSLGRRTLDLAGLLRHLLGAERPVGGMVYSAGELSPAWRQQASGLGFRVEAPSPGLRRLVESGRVGEAADVLLLCGAWSDVLDDLPWLRPRRGRLGALADRPPQRLPGAWEPLALPALGPWFRIGRGGLA